MAPTVDGHPPHLLSMLRSSPLPMFMTLTLSPTIIGSICHPPKTHNMMDFAHSPTVPFPFTLFSPSLSHFTLSLSNPRHPCPCTSGLPIPLGHLASMLWFPSSFQNKTNKNKKRSLSSTSLSPTAQFLCSPAQQSCSGDFFRVGPRPSFLVLTYVGLSGPHPNCGLATSVRSTAIL